MVFNFHYKISNSIIKNSSCIKDLGIYIDNHLTFQEHVDHISSAAMKSLGFIIRSTIYFSNPRSTFSLFLINKLEAPQRKFLRNLAFKSGTRMNLTDHNPTPISTKFDLPTVNSRFDSFLLCEHAYLLRNARILCEIFANDELDLNSSIARLTRT